MDVDGRVLRLDSWSKIVSGGLRMGFATAAPDLIRVLCIANQSSLIHSSGVSQLVLLALLRRWGVGDSESTDPTGLGELSSHITRIQGVYRQQRDAMVCAVKRHLRRRPWDGTAMEDHDDCDDLLVSFKLPQAGMFLWMHCHGVTDAQPIATAAARAGLLFIHGAAFFASGGPRPYIRVSFSLVSPSQMDEGMRILGEILRNGST